MYFKSFKHFFSNRIKTICHQTLLVLYYVLRLHRLQHVHNYNAQFSTIIINGYTE